MARSPRTSAFICLLTLKCTTVLSGTWTGSPFGRGPLRACRCHRRTANLLSGYYSAADHFMTSLADYEEFIRCDLRAFDNDTDIDRLSASDSNPDLPT